MRSSAASEGRDEGLYIVLRLPPAGAEVLDVGAAVVELRIVAFGHEDEFMPAHVGLPRHGNLLRLEQSIEIVGPFRRT